MPPLPIVVTDVKKATQLILRNNFTSQTETHIWFCCKDAPTKPSRDEQIDRVVSIYDTRRSQTDS